MKEDDLKGSPSPPSAETNGKILPILMRGKSRLMVVRFSVVGGREVLEGSGGRSIHRPS